MEKQEKQNLLKKLDHRMRYAKMQSKIIDEPNKDIIIKEEKLNPKYISSKQYFQLAQFYQFLINNPDITEDDARELLNSKIKFSYLRRVDKLVPNFISELKHHGPMSIAISYIENKHNVTML